MVTVFIATTVPGKIYQDNHEDGRVPQAPGEDLLSLLRDIPQPATHHFVTHFSLAQYGFARIAGKA